jgi:hypothetical protein
LNIAAQSSFIVTAIRLSLTTVSQRSIIAVRLIKTG